MAVTIANVGCVITDASSRRCYLAEWYRPELTGHAIDDALAKLERGAEAISVNGSAVRLLAMLAAPTDEVLYGVFAADTPEIVRQACHQAGFPVERLTVDVDARITSSSPNPRPIASPR